MCCFCFIYFLWYYNEICWFDTSFLFIVLEQAKHCSLLVLAAPCDLVAEQHGVIAALLSRGIVAVGSLVEKFYLPGHTVVIKILRVFSFTCESHNFVKVINFFQDLAVEVVEQLLKRGWPVGGGWGAHRGRMFDIGGLLREFTALYDSPEVYQLNFMLARNQIVLRKDILVSLTEDFLNA